MSSISSYTEQWDMIMMMKMMTKSHLLIQVKQGVIIINQMNFKNNYLIFRDVSSYFHLNYHGLNSNWDSLLCDLHAESFAFHFFGISEVLGNTNDGYFCLPGYHEFLAQRRDVRSLLYKI